MSSLEERRDGGGRSERRPVVLVTGPLGSGKTSLLRDALDQAAPVDIDMVVGDIGEESIDSDLFARAGYVNVGISGECMCCSGLEGMMAALTELSHPHRPFRGIVIEASGLAESSALIGALGADPVMSARLAIRRVVACADLTSWRGTGMPQDILRDQIRAADTLVLTKTDLAVGAERARFEARLSDLNPIARIVERDQSIRELFAPGWQDRLAPLPETAAASHGHRHTDIAAFSLHHEGNITSAVLGEWLFALSTILGQDLIRLKGIAVCRERTTPVAFHVVNGVLFPLEPVTGAGTATHPLTATVIGRNLDRDALRDTLDLALARHMEPSAGLPSIDALSLS
ncbi:CobW family GTP-binding protein [Stappia stellulata]|uniref:CobW family GTP-binding protein n=1 Tax=Stappia stellulata TaxID=71235 RepID=UPI00041EFF05|nr:GTP-binding protein [Stappia stellulata]